MLKEREYEIFTLLYVRKIFADFLLCNFVMRKTDWRAPFRAPDEEGKAVIRYRSLPSFQVWKREAGQNAGRNRCLNRVVLSDVGNNPRKGTSTSQDLIMGPNSWRWSVGSNLTCSVTPSPPTLFDNASPAQCSWYDLLSRECHLTCCVFIQCLLPVLPTGMHAHKSALCLAHSCALAPCLPPGRCLTNLDCRNAE